MRGPPRSRTNRRLLSASGASALTERNVMTFGMAAVTVVTALLAQQPLTPYYGSVSKGAITAEPLKLSVVDVVQRALQSNLGLLLQQENETTARSARMRALA